jgi:NAD(P)H-flavin reductase
MEPKKLTVTLTKKTHVLNQIYELLFEVPEAITFRSGQFANLGVEIGIWRSYSIVEILDNQLKILIDLKIGGPASIYLSAAKVGDKFEMILPLGNFILQKNKTPKTFVTTGTGIAPIIPMLKELKTKAKLFFGLREMKDNLVQYLPEVSTNSNVEIVYCLSQQNSELPQNAAKGRVTDVLRDYSDDVVKSEIYIAGNPQMVFDTAILLKELGVEDLYMERY